MPSVLASDQSKHQFLRVTAGNHLGNGDHADGDGSGDAGTRNSCKSGAGQDSGDTEAGPYK